MADDGRDLDRLRELLDRHGPDFTGWPAGAAARWARELVLAEPEARRVLDEARHLDELLDSRFDRLAAQAKQSRLDERMVEAVAPALVPRARDTQRWAARLAASFLVACVLGGVFEHLASRSAVGDETEIVMLDSLLFGPGETELR